MKRRLLSRNSLMVLLPFSATILLALFPRTAVGAGITITHPDVPGIVWTAGQEVTVTWTYTDLPPAQAITVRLRRGSGGPGMIIGLIGGRTEPAFAIGDGYATFRLPTWLPDDDHYVVEVTPSRINHMLISDESDVEVAVHGGVDTMSVELTSPDASTDWAAGTTQALTWNTSNPIGMVSLSLFDYNSDTMWGYPNMRAAFVGECEWPIPTNTGDSTDFTIIAMGTPWPDGFLMDAAMPFDESPRFEIHGSDPRPTITVTSPNGGETLASGSPVPVCWTTSEAEGLVRVTLSSESKYEEPSLMFRQFSGNSVCKNWTPCRDLDGDDFRVKVTLFLDGSNRVADESDSVFSITPVEPNPSIELTWPNGGEVVPAGTIQAIAWDTADSFSESVHADLLSTTQEGTGTRRLGSGPAITCGSSGDYCGELDAAFCPELQGDAEYRVETCITRPGCFSICDSSDASFEITPFPPGPTVELISPVGGEVWTAASTRTIRWNAENATGMVVDVMFPSMSTTSGYLIGSVPAEVGSVDFFVLPIFSGLSSQSVRLRIMEGDCERAVDRSGPITVTTIDCTCGDIDGNVSVDLYDYALFADCIGQPLSTSTECTCSDLNGDQQIDLLDFSIFANLMGTGSGNLPPDCP